MNIFRDVSTLTLETNELDTEIVVLIWVAVALLILLIFVAIYLLIILRRSNIVLKKVDYLVEDWIYKSELLNTGIESLANIQNYIDIFNATFKRNIKSIANLAFRNRNLVYYFFNKIKESSHLDSSKSKKTTSTTSTPSAKRKPSDGKVQKTTSKKSVTKKTTSSPKTMKVPDQSPKAKDLKKVKTKDLKKGDK